MIACIVKIEKTVASSVVIAVSDTRASKYVAGE
jgi:hypothetical protein